MNRILHMQLHFQSETRAGPGLDRAGQGLDRARAGQGRAGTSRAMLLLGSLYVSSN